MEIYGNILQYKHFAVHDGDGIRTTLFLKGCPLACAWCHNPEGISPKPQLAYLEHKCIGCGECSVCPTGAHRFIGDNDESEVTAHRLHSTDATANHNHIHSYDRSLCTACGRCADLCLGGALTMYGRRVSLTDAANELLCDRGFYDESGGGVTLSGGEPLTQPEFCAALFRIMRGEGVSTALDTCGFVPRDALASVLPYTDKLLYDVKAADSELHRRYTGQPNELIIDNLRYADSWNIPIEIRIPLISGVNTAEADAIAELLAPLKSVEAVRILPYHGYAEAKYASLGMKYRGRGFEPPSRELLDEFKSKLAGRGLKVIISGAKNECEVSGDE